MHMSWEFKFRNQKIVIDKHLEGNKYFIMVNGNKVQKQSSLEEVITWMADIMMDGSE